MQNPFHTYRNEIAQLLSTDHDDAPDGV
jgi:hypothetical protein